MAVISVTESIEGKGNLYYVQSATSETFSYTGCRVEINETGARSTLTVHCPEEYSEIILLEIADKTAEVIAVKYKNDFFKKGVTIDGLTPIEREILIASLIAADFEEDKKYAVKKLRGFDEYSLDGIFNFRMKPLKEKLKEITGYLPSSFTKSQLKDFISYLIKDKKGKE